MPSRLVPGENRGGADRGPEPAQLFVVSLGSCVAAIVLAYCETHDLDAIDFEFEGERGAGD